MPREPGRYDAVCVGILQSAQARAVALVVIGDDMRASWSVRGDHGSPSVLPELLRKLADAIEREQQNVQL